MPRFRVKSVGSDGTIFSRELEAHTERAAIAQLQDAGHHPIGAEEISGVAARWTLPTILSGVAVSQRDVSDFTRELATLLGAGIPLDAALQTVMRLVEGRPMARIVLNLREKVQGGVAFSDALANHISTFGPLYVNMVRAGEAGGDLDTVMQRLADYLERMGRLRSSVVTALIYPAILAVMSLLSLFALMLFVIPQFVPLFEDLNQPLPLLTQIIFWVAGILRGYWWLLLGIAVAAGWYFRKRLADPVTRGRWDAWVLRLPWIGSLLTEFEVAAIARTLGTLLQSGVPLLAAVRLARGVVGNRAIASVCDNVASSLEQGFSMAAPLRQSNRFPPTAVQLIEVGEESGQLDVMLNKVADILDNQVAESLKRMLALLEPVLILGLGGVIAVIIISVLLAILSLQSLVV